jgi:hypothetical protein
MDSVRLNFPRNSPTPCVPPMELPNAFIVNDLRSRSVVDNICSFDRSMLVLLACIWDIWIYQSFWRGRNHAFFSLRWPHISGGCAGDFSSLRTDASNFWFFDQLEKKIWITLYTENWHRCHRESMRFFFHGEIFRPINTTHFCESTRFSRSIEDSVCVWSSGNWKKKWNKEQLDWCSIQSYRSKCVVLI